jgi:deoxyhypusine synthase
MLERVDRGRQEAASATSRTSSSTACCVRAKLEKYYQIDPKDSWMLAACEKNLPIFVPGWEDSTTGQHLRQRHVMRGDVKNVHTVRTGIEYMMRTLIDWYTRPERELEHRLLPDRRRHRRRLPDLRGADAASGPAAATRPYWGYFCQISDSTTSYGSYSAARCPTRRSPGASSDIDTPKLHHRERRDHRPRCPRFLRCRRSRSCP